MKKTEPQYKLPGDIEHYLAVLSKVYAQNGEHKKLEIIVNSQIRVHECWRYDNWDGGTYGHALFLILPESLFVSAIESRDALQSEIAADINKIHNVQNEHIAEVFFEMQRVDDHDWRRESGALNFQNRIIQPDTVARIWGDGSFRLFLSHKTEVKKEVAELKLKLSLYGINCFVAHEDILPTKQWQDEIESALISMDGFVALLTDRFHDSNWTDQEVGFALGRGVPIIAVRLGLDPYGFIAKFQALTCAWNDAPLGIVGLLIHQPKVLEAYIKAMQDCHSFDEGNTLARVLPNIQQLTEDQALKMYKAFRENDQLRGSFGFFGNKPREYGDGLLVHLKRITGRNNWA